MTLDLYTVDAFAERPFSGNPASVCLLDGWLDDRLMQDIAAENNHAETAFVVREKQTFTIRWFTPTVEVDLCGHATLAAAHVIYNYSNFGGQAIEFNSRSGMLRVHREKDQLVLNFPADKLQPATLPVPVIAAIGLKPALIFRGISDYMLVYSNQEEIVSLKPDFALIQQVKTRGFIVTAPGDRVDFVSRFFAPQSGIDEDPVTGSAHTSLIPYWSLQLGKKELTAMQLSRREGTLYCKDLGDRVEIGGKARTYLVGKIEFDINP